MSETGESLEHEVSTEDLLKMIAMKLDILIRHNEKLNGEVFTEEDLDHDDN